MNLFIYTGASRLNAAVVESATDLTAVSRLPDLIVGDSEPVTVKFLSASGAYESWSGGGTYTLSISIGALGGDGIAAYFQTSSFTTVTNGWTGRLNLASGSLPSVVAGYLAERPGAQSVPLFVQVRVTDADGNTETYARQAVSISGAVSVPTTANSTPVTYATAADVAADASTASAAAIAAAASASAAAGSASTAAGHVTTAGNSATAAAASAVTAGNSATTASGHATTATTQATNAATSASSASTYKDAAAVSAASATSSAGTATTQAALATTNGAAQVALAAAQVTLATTQATNAGTSASAAAVSAAAALVSEAAALVSKNAAAASAATASAVSGSGNGTFSAAALTGVNTITASASTALTLTGGSTGASLVLGQGANADATLAYKGTGKVAFNRWVAASATAPAALAAGAGSIYFQTNGSVAGTQDSWVFDTGYTDQSYRFKIAGTDRMVIAANTGNLLIGTTTDMTGSGGLKIAGTTGSATPTSGALQVIGGAGIGGAIYGGGIISAVNTVYGKASGEGQTATMDPGFYRDTVSNVTTQLFGFGNGSRGGVIRGFQNGGNTLVWDFGGITASAFTAHMALTAQANSVTSGALNILLTTPSTTTTSGALIVAGGVGVSGAGYFGGVLNVTGAATFAGAVTANGQLIAKGTATNDSAATGYIGEYVTASLANASAVSLAVSGMAYSLTSISLTAGDWDVSGVANFKTSSATTSYFVGGASTSPSGFTAGEPSYFSVPIILTTTTLGASGYVIPDQRISLTATTTIYLVGQVGFSAGTVSGYGSIRARRVR